MLAAASTVFITTQISLVFAAQAVILSGEELNEVLAGTSLHRYSKFVDSSREIPDLI